MRGEHVVGETHRGTLAPGRNGRHGDGACLDGTPAATGTSIFDPVLCELVYRWFCPPAGHVLDPFAGGSVRGIVSAVLGRDYTGIDLRPEQAAANEAQWRELSSRLAPVPLDISGLVPVKVSAKMARLPFHGCDPEYITTTCHASCCDSSTSPTGTMITIHPSEEHKLEPYGVVIAEGFLQPRAGEKKCPFKSAASLCALHQTPDKPFGCIASPFTLNTHNTLIVRHRYKLLRCYDDGPKLPAYRAFRASLDLIFGAEEAQRITDHLDTGGGDLTAMMPVTAYGMLRDNDDIKRGSFAQSGASPRWMVGDSRDIAQLADGPYDLVFTCPPYADLEVYSDDPRDLSTMDYEAFLEAYRLIIRESTSLLAENRFAAIVVGDVRDRHGFYRNFVSDTIRAFQDAGLKLYNEAILVTAVGSLPIRVGKQFTSGRKLGKTHQNMLVFVKGDPRKATEACGEVEAYDPFMTADQ
jgi:DNA modification methylase